MAVEKYIVSTSDLLEIPSFNQELTLKQFTLSDAQDIFELIDHSREHLSQNGENTPDKYQTLESVEDSILNQPNPTRLRFAIREKSGKLVGSINLTPDEDDPDRGEVGYYLGADDVGKGYMGQALRMLTDFAFGKLNYEEIFGVVAENNIASVKVLQKTGFMETGIYRDKKKEQGIIIFTKKRSAGY